MMRVQRVQMIPVHMSAKLLCAEICSGGNWNCENVTHASPHFITGACKASDRQLGEDYPIQLTTDLTKR